MSRATILILGNMSRGRAHNLVEKVPVGTRIEFKGERRTLPQNDKMWAMLTDIARQADHNGRKYKADIWKLLFMHGWRKELEFIPSLEQQPGEVGMVPIGYSSSGLSRAEMSELIEFITAWGTQNGIVFSDGQAG